MAGTLAGYARAGGASLAGNVGAKGMIFSGVPCCEAATLWLAAK